MRLGATVDEVVKLERILMRAIILKDIAEEDIYNSGKYGRCNYRPLELMYYNGHAWPKDLHFQQSREVHIYEGDVWQAIRQATHGEPLALWLLDGQDSSQLTNLFSRTAAPTGHGKPTKDSRWSVKLWVIPRLPRKRSERTNHAASIRAKEKNGWKPTPASLLPDIQKACVEHSHGGLWNLMDYDTKDIVNIDMKACYPASSRS